MPAYIDKTTQKKFFLCTPAKTGGSSVRDCFLGNNIERAPLAVIGGSQEQPWTHVDANMAAIAWPGKMPSICMARHPYTRILSHYNYIVSHAFCGAIKYHDKTSPWATINSWVEYIYGEEGQYYKLPVKGNPMLHSSGANFGHLRPQVSLLYEDTKIYKMEDGFEPLYSWVEEYVGRPLKGKDVWHNRNKKFFEVEDMTDRTKQLLFEAYSQDFKMFKYNP